MNPKDNIDKFFQKRLQDSSPEEEAWNVPSDELWNKAKVHFPKEKKKKRPFFFFLWGGAVLSLAIIALAIYLFNGNEKTANKALENIAVVSPELKESINERSLKEDKNISSGSMASLASSESNQSATHEDAKLDIPQPDNSAEANSPAQEKRHLKTASKTAKIKKAVIDRAILADREEIQSLPRETNQNQTFLNPSEADNKTENKVVISSKDIVLPTSVPFEKTITIESLPTLVSSVESDKEVFEPKSELKFIKPRRSIRKWELGLSFSPFILNPEWLIENDESNPNESYELKMHYLNINVPISRRLSRRFSLTSGISLAQLKLDLGFESKEVYNMNDTEGELRDIINDSATSGSLAINDESSDVQIEFKPDANLMDGDSILVKGFVPIKLQIIQFPLLINYHFGKKKLEGLIHAGIGLDYFYGEVASIDLEAFHDNQLVTEPVVFEPVRDAAFGYSLYFGVGMKYHFTDRFNVGLSTKLDFTELLLSRHELGIYYRF